MGQKPQTKDPIAAKVDALLKRFGLPATSRPPEEDVFSAPSKVPAKGTSR